MERSSEWNTEVWLALVDFEKAFDTVEHDSLWKALEELGVEPAYVDLLKALYSNQVATVAAQDALRRAKKDWGVAALAHVMVARRF